MVQQSNRLTVTLPTDTEVLMTRAFDARRELVWQAMTEPEHVRQWWGQSGSTLSVCEIDLRVGGAWRYVEWATDGNEYPFKGEYREIVRPERLAYTFIFDVEPYTDKTCEVTMTLEEGEEGRTLMTAVTRFATKEDRDGMVDSGMERGAGETYERLDEHLESIS